MRSKQSEEGEKGKGEGSREEKVWPNWSTDPRNGGRGGGGTNPGTLTKMGKKRRNYDLIL